MIGKTRLYSARLGWCRHAQLANCALCLTFASCIYVWWIQPAADSLATARQQVARAGAELQQNQERIEDLERTKAEVAQLRVELSRLTRGLPQMQNLSVFIDDVTRRSQQTGVKRLAWHLNAAASTTDHLTATPVQVTFEGDFLSNVLTFLQATESLPRLTRIRRFQLTASDSVDGQVRAELDMNLYSGGQ